MEILLMLFTVLIMISISTTLIMIIWNNVIIKKFPDSNIQTLSFWDSLALAVFASLLQCRDI